MSDDTQINTPPTPNTDQGAEEVVDPQVLVNEALAVPTTPTPIPTPPAVPEQTETPATEETRVAGEEIKEPTPQIKEELPLAFSPKIDEPTTQPEPATEAPTPNAVEPVKPIETPPPVSEPKKKGKGGKILLTVLGLFLLVSSVVGGFFIYQQQFGETPRVAEVANKDWGSCKSGSSCLNAPPSRIFEGDCVLYYCPNGVIDPTKCGDNDPGVQISHGNCNDLEKKVGEDPNMKKCWQIDATDRYMVYCNVEGEGCDSDLIETSGCGEPPVVKHSECNSNHACVQVNGAGTDQCSTNQDCAVVKHSECNSNHACVQVNGAGTDQCSTNSDCIEKIPTLTCSSLTKNKADNQIKIGTRITFTCAGDTISGEAMGGSSGGDTGNPTFPISYSYRIRKDGGAWQNLVTTTSSDGVGETASYMVRTAGSYRAQCRACITVLGKKICDPIWNETPPGGGTL
ncbi:MAG: hypothetical protein ABII80_02435 [bacterium]